MECKTEFGLVCSHLLRDIRNAPGAFKMFMRVYDSQFSIARTAYMHHPDLCVDPDKPETWLVFCCFPLQVAKDGGEIRFKFPHRSDSYRTIGKATIENSILQDFQPDEKTVEMLFNCLEAWIQFDCVSEEGGTVELACDEMNDVLYVTKKQLDSLLVSVKAETLRKDRRVDWPDADSPQPGTAKRYDYLQVRSAIEKSRRPDSKHLLSLLPVSLDKVRSSLAKCNV